MELFSVFRSSVYVFNSFLDNKAVFDFEFQAAKLVIYMQCKVMHAWGAERAPGVNNLLEQFNQFNQARTEWKTGSRNPGHRHICIKLSVCLFYHISNFDTREGDACFHMTGVRRPAVIISCLSCWNWTNSKIWNKNKKQKNAENLRHKLKIPQNNVFSKYLSN